jgi:hypothetical protein
MPIITKPNSVYSIHRPIKWIFYFTFLVNTYHIYSCAQGFYQTNIQTSLDTLLDSRKEITTESSYFFHHLTNYKFYDFNELNEFEKAKQMRHLEEVTQDIRSNWKSRYKISFDGYKCISTEQDNNKWLFLSSYDFQTNSFQVTFQEFDIIEIVDISNEKLNSFLSGKVPPTAAPAKAFLSFKIEPTQKKSYTLFLKPDVAESFKSYVNDNRITCDILINIIADPTFSTELIETTQFREYKIQELEKYKKSGGFVHTFDNDGLRTKKPHPFNKMSTQQREKEIIKQFKLLYTGVETHYVLYNMNLPCRIQGIRFFADKDKLLEWRPK